MSTLFAIAVMAAVPVLIVLIGWREVVNIRRSRTWVRTEGVFCADAEALALKPSWQMKVKRSRTVLFEGPDGPCIAPLLYGGFIGPGSSNIGKTVPIIYDPNDPMRVEIYETRETHFWSLLILVGLLALIALGVGVHILRG